MYKEYENTKIDLGWWLYNSVNILKETELYTLSWWIVWLWKAIKNVYADEFGEFSEVELTDFTDEIIETIGEKKSI